MLQDMIAIFVYNNQSTTFSLHNVITRDMYVVQRVQICRVKLIAPLGLHGVK
jgi:hypothetical protein